MFICLFVFFCMQCNVFLFMLEVSYRKHLQEVFLRKVHIRVVHGLLYWFRQVRLSDIKWLIQLNEASLVFCILIYKYHKGKNYQTIIAGKLSCQPAPDRSLIFYFFIFLFFPSSDLSSLFTKILGTIRLLLLSFKYFSPVKKSC